MKAFYKIIKGDSRRDSMAERGKRKIKSGAKPPRKREMRWGEKKVAFTFYAPEAGEVFLAGDFNQWDTRSVPMKKDRSGNWKAEFKLAPGCYEYKLVADNTWVEHLPGAELVSNPFGTNNFIMWVR